MAKEKEKRHTCKYCGEKRYESDMVIVFSHPVITNGKAIWACREVWYRPNKCETSVVQDLMLYAETGLLCLTISPVKK